MSRTKKWIYSAIILLFGLLLTSVALLPTLLSTGGGKRYVTALIEKSSGAKVTIEELSFSWMGDQKIDRFTYDDGEGVRLGFDQLVSSCSFWNLLFRSGSVGETRLQAPWVNFQTRPSVKQPTGVVKGGKKQEKAGEFWSNFSGKIIFEKGSFDLFNSSIKDLYLAFGADSDRYTLIARGRTEQNALYGDFNIDIKIDKWIEGVATVNRLPIEGIDQLVTFFNPKYQGLLLAALGDSLNVNLSNGSLNLRSPRLLIDIDTTYQNSSLTLTKAGRIAWTVKPQIFNRLIDGAQLKNDAQAEIRLESATLPLKNLEKLSADGNLYFSGGSLFFEEIEQTIFISELSCDFQTNRLKELVDLSFRSSISTASSSEAQGTGRVTIRNPLEKSRFFPKYDLRVDNFPVALIDSWMKSESVKYLGQSVSGRVMKSDERMVISATTPLLNMPEAEFIITDAARLINPISLTYQLRETLYDQLTRPVMLTGRLNSLSIPMDRERLELSKALFNLQLKAQNVGVQNLLALGTLTLPFINLDLEAKTLSNIQFNGTSRLDFSPQTLGISLIGSEVGVKLSGRLKWDGEVEISPLLAEFDGQKFKGTLDGAIEKSTLILKKPLIVDFLLEPEQVNSILAKEGNIPLLSKATPFHLEVRPSRLPLSETALSSLSLKGSGHIDNLSMYSPVNGYAFNFEDVAIDFDFDGKRDSRLIHFEARALENGKSGGQIELEIKTPTQVKVIVKGFSSQIADAFFGMRGQLPDMIGATLNLNYQMVTKGDKQEIDLKIDSPDFSLEGAFTVGDQLELRTPRRALKMGWNISEEAYDAFQRWQRPGVAETPNNPLFTIEGRSKIKIEVSPLSIPVKERGKGIPKLDFNLLKSLFDVHLRIDDLTLKQRIETTLSRFDFNIAKQAVGNTPMEFKFNGSLRTHSSGQSGRVRGEGELENFLSSEGHLDLSNVTTEIHATIKNLPTLFIDALTRLDQNGGYPPSAFLGDLMNATFDADIQKSQGSISMDVDATGCRGTFSGVVSDGTLYLREPIQAVFTVTPQLNRILEKSANLIVVGMEKPILLHINPKGFSVPLKDLHIRNMNFNYGQLDLGQIVCENSGSASDVSSLLKTDGTKHSSFWFAPMEFNMRSGKMYVDRTEILYNQAYQVCLWGKVNFVRRYVQMTLGLTAQTLGSALRISGLSPNYVLKVPVEGPFGNVKIDSGAASGKIAFLIARKQIAPQAGIWGQVLGAIGDLADDQSDVPPPKPPFPWQKRR